MESIDLREQLSRVIDSASDADLLREIYKLIEPDEPDTKPRLVDGIIHWLSDSEPVEIDFGQMKREAGIKAIKGRALGEEVVEALNYLIERKCVLKVAHEKFRDFSYPVNPIFYEVMEFHPIKFVQLVEWLACSKFTHFSLFEVCPDAELSESEVDDFVYHANDMKLIGDYRDDGYVVGRNTILIRQVRKIDPQWRRFAAAVLAQHFRRPRRV